MMPLCVAMVLASSPIETPALSFSLQSFSLQFSRTHQANGDSAVVIATVLNRSSTAFETWGRFEFWGGYKESAETALRMKARADSVQNARKGSAAQRHFRADGPRPPGVYLVPSLKPLHHLKLKPLESYSDTLKLSLTRQEFSGWLPGYFEVTATFITGTASTKWEEAYSTGGKELRIAIPIP